MPLGRVRFTGSSTRHHGHQTFDVEQTTGIKIRHCEEHLDVAKRLAEMGAMYDDGGRLEVRESPDGDRAAPKTLVSGD